MAEGTEQTLKIVGGFLLVVVFTLAYVLGQNAQTKTQKNMQSRLDLTRQRFQNCDTERRMLSGSMKGKEHDELKIAEQDHQALVSENQLLNEDNQQLRQDNYALEEQIDELRDELDDKDFVSDDEVEQLEDAMSFGNNSAELKEFLDDAQILGGINKDTLITKLMAELKVKRQNLSKCKAKKGLPSLKSDSDDDLKFSGEQERKVKTTIKKKETTPWDEMDETEQKTAIKHAIAKIAAIKVANITSAAPLIKKWAKRHPAGVEGLMAAVAKGVKRLKAENEASEQNKKTEEEEAVPMKKSKKVVAPETEDTEDKTAIKRPTQKSVKKEDSNDEEETTTKKVVKKPKLVDAKNTDTKANGEDDDQPAVKKVKKVVPKDESEEEEPKKVSTKIKTDDDDEETSPKKVAMKTKAAVDDDDDDAETTPKRKASSVNDDDDVPVKKSKKRSE
jgi:hypothetical protein